MGTAKSIAVAAVGLCAALLVSACGGGGSSNSQGGGSSNSQPSMSVSPQRVSASSTTTAPTPPISTVTLSTSNPTSTPLYAGYKDTTNGISAINFVPVSSTVASVEIVFKSPSVLGVGTFSDTLELAVCTDSQCKSQIPNSPQFISVQYTITQGDPALVAPTPLTLIPSSTTQGGTAFTLAITGQNFESQSVVQWNGSARATSYISPTQVSAQISAGDIANGGTAQVSVSNQATGGGNSSPLSFTILPAPPNVSSISPSSANVGAPAFTLTVNGSYFDFSSAIQLNGTSLTTTYVSNTQITAQVPASALAAPGVLSIDVFDTSTSLKSKVQNLTVGYAPLTLAALSPQSVTAGAPAFVLTVFGTGFTQGSTVQWNGGARATTVVSPTEVLAQINLADIASVGSATIDVVNTAANAGTSSSAILTIAAPSIDAVAYQINASHSGTIQFANIVSPGALPSIPTWTANLGLAVTYPLIVGGKVYVVVAPSNQAIYDLYALNLMDGSIAWGPVVLPGAPSGVAYDAGKIFIALNTIQNVDLAIGELQSYDATSGTLLWSANTLQPWLNAPTAANGMVFVNGYGDASTVYAFTETGTPAWSVATNGTMAVVAVTSDGVYVTYPCLTYDLRPGTGETIWLAQTQSTGCFGINEPVSVVANGLLYSPTGPTIAAGQIFNAETGASTGQTYISQTAPAVGSQASYYLQSQSGALIAVSSSTGSLLWSFTGDGTLLTAPVLVNNYLFIGSVSGNLYMIDATTGTQLQAVTLAPFVAESSGLAAGDGVLIVPAGNSINAFTLSTNP
jgi:outer membrane protein assembly factor BamB